VRRIIISNYESAEAVVCCLVISKRVENFQLGADGKATKAKWYNLYMRSETDALIIAINNCGGVTIFSFTSSTTRFERMLRFTETLARPNLSIPF
jgi:hypothetical protein